MNVRLRSWSIRLTSEPAGENYWDLRSRSDKNNSAAALSCPCVPFHLRATMLLKLVHEITLTAVSARELCAGLPVTGEDKVNIKHVSISHFNPNTDRWERDSETERN